MTPKKLLIILVLLTAAFIAGLVIYVNSIISEGLPSLEELENPSQNFATQVLSADGALLDHFYIERRINLPLDSIPDDFINALIATEDRAYWDHWGIHVARIFKAAVKDIMAMRLKEGASTITMQLARNLYLNRENTLNRKIKEAFTAVQIEQTYSKVEILEMYCNTVAFGRGAYGIQVASQVYFDKPPMELSTAECAFLIGLLKAPEYYNKQKNEDRALGRRNLILRLMHDQGFLTATEFAEAIEEPINIHSGYAKIQKRRRDGFFAPHFVEMIRQSMNEKPELKGYDLYRDGLVIHTTLNSRMQQYANEAVEEHLVEFQKMFEQKWSWAQHQNLLNDLINEAIKARPEYKAASSANRKSISDKLKNSKAFIDSVKNVATTIQAGLVILDPATGAIKAIVGASPKFMEEHPNAKYSLNHVTQIVRQPGSAFKPFVYARALESGLTPDYEIECGPFSYKTETDEVWSPRGTGDCEPGDFVTLYEGLRRSINTVAARLVTNYTSPGAIVELLRKTGIDTRLEAVPAIALGAGGEVKPIQLTSAYGAFAYNGIHLEPYFYTTIENRNGEIIDSKRITTDVTDALNKNITVQLTYMLQRVVDAGTAYRIREYLTGVDAAGKTGTTNDAADAWFVGYTPQLVAGVWVGFDDRRITFDPIGSQGYGGRAAAPIWGRLMGKIYSDQTLPYKQKEFSFAVSDTSGFNIEKYYLPAQKNYLKRKPKMKKDSVEKESDNFLKLPFPNL
ncbi:MAG: penicillin-binding protein 1A [Candidatus Kapaibacterium sp.]